MIYKGHKFRLLEEEEVVVPGDSFESVFGGLIKMGKNNPAVYSTVEEINRNRNKTNKIHFWREEINN